MVTHCLMLLLMHYKLSNKLEYVNRFYLVLNANYLITCFFFIVVVSVLNYMAIGTIGTIAAVATGSIGSIVAGILGIYYTDFGGTLIVLGFLTGYGLADVIVEILDAAVLLMLMCMCEDTSSISKRVPELEVYLRTKYPTECGSLFSRK